MVLPSRQYISGSIEVSIPESGISQADVANDDVVAEHALNERRASKFQRATLAEARPPPTAVAINDANIIANTSCEMRNLVCELQLADNNLVVKCLKPQHLRFCAMVSLAHHSFGWNRKSFCAAQFPNPSITTSDSL